MRSPVPPRHFALALVVPLLLAPLAQAQEAEAPAEAPPATDEAAESPSSPEVVKEIRVEGNRRVEAEAVRRALITKVGQPFDPRRTSADLRALYGLHYFEDIRLLVQRQPDGIVYVVQVKERPVIREVRLVGNKEVSTEDLKEVLDLKPFSILDRDAVRRNARKIQEKYVEKGYYLADVNWRVEPRPDGNAVNVFFDIRENAKVLIKEIRFLGVKKVPESALREVLALKEGGYLSFLTNEGVYREEMLQRDLAIIQALYYDRGFINVQVQKPQVSISPDRRFIYITIPIEEGDEFRVGELDVAGDLLLPREELLARMGSKPGDVFSRSRMSTDIGTLTDVYYDRGYAYANIVPNTRVDAENKTIHLTFEIDKGEPVTIERIDMVGNTKTRDKVIRRELRIFEGELYNGTALKKSRERVFALGFFETVEITQKKGSQDDTMVLTVEVKEKPTGTFQVGLGFSNVENFILTAQIQQQNFLGWGQAVSLNVQASSLRQYYQASYYDPYFLDTNFLFSADAFRIQADYQGFIRDSTGGNITFGRYLTPEYDLTASLTLTYEYVHVEPGQGLAQIPLANQFRSGDTRSARASLTWDRRNNRLFPSDGFMLFGSAELAPGFVGSDFRFARFNAYARGYKPLPFLGIVAKANINVGYITQLEADSPLPISELYFLGGVNTIRGYYLRSISPTVRVLQGLSPDSSVYRDPVTLKDYGVGGNKQIIFNGELEFPILEKVGVRGVLFYDAGNAFALDSPFFRDRQNNLPLGLFHSVGFGFRWFSPIGPLRFEWGIPLNKRPNDDPVLFEFNIGNFF